MKILYTAKNIKIEERDFHEVWKRVPKNIKVRNPAFEKIPKKAWENEGDKKEFAKTATEKGIERITELGKMSYFDYPWDGMFPINRFVRWVSLSS